MKAITKGMTIVAFTVGVLGIHDALAERDYDLNTVKTVWGKVLSIEKTAPPKRRSDWVDLILQTGQETIAVHLGPAWFMDKQTPRIEANDIIMVTGSRVTVNGNLGITAADIKKGNEVLKLRENNGIPVWPRTGARSVAHQ
jgi:hypothetical protein